MFFEMEAIRSKWESIGADLNLPLSAGKVCIFPSPEPLPSKRPRYQYQSNELGQRLQLTLTTARATLTQWRQGSSSELDESSVQHTLSK